LHIAKFFILFFIIDYKYIFYVVIFFTLLYVMSFFYSIVWFNSIQYIYICLWSRVI